MVSKLIFLLAALQILIGCDASSRRADRVEATETRTEAAARMALPAPSRAGHMSLEEALARRRSVREFSGKPLTEQQIGQLLWAAQGITDPAGFRTAPSAGALYPLEIYVATAGGFFQYEPRQHQLLRRSARDLRPDLQRAALGQAPVGEAPAVFVIAGVQARTAKKYGEVRSQRYVDLEAGHAAQNLLLEAVALDLGAVPIGAFEDAQVQRVLALPADQRPLYLIPVGYRR